MQELVKVAADSAVSRGHRLTDWDGDQNYQSAECVQCGAGVSVTIAPPPNGIDIGGEAVAVNCDGGTYNRAIEYARKRGQDDGTNAAEWYVQDSFGSRQPNGTESEGAALILQGIEDGDPEVLDSFPTADLSGEDEDELAHTAFVEAGWLDRAECPCNEYQEQIAEAYESAFSQAVEDEISRAARYMLAPVE